MPSARKLTHADVIGLLNAAIAGAGSVAELARRIGCSDAHLFHVREGLKPPGPKVLAHLGLVRVETVHYERRRRVALDAAAGPAENV